jgi:hypothetical protein
VSGYRYVYSRRIRGALESGDFRIGPPKPYENEFHEAGIEYECDYRGRQFYISQGMCDEEITVTVLKKVLKDDSHISTKVPLIWPNKLGQDGLYLEAWYLGRWYKFHTPIRPIQHGDEFTELVTTIVARK